jgi:hypothetical protein
MHRDTVETGGCQRLGSKAGGVTTNEFAVLSRVTKMSWNYSWVLVTHACNPSHFGD